MPANSDTAAPRRIQRSRAKGWRMPDGAVSVSRPGIWGNPYRVTVGDDGRCWVEVRLAGINPATGDDVEIYGPYPDKPAAAKEAVSLFRRKTIPQMDPDAVRTALGGHDLACWCRLDQPCHADVLLEIANGKPVI